MNKITTFLLSGVMSVYSVAATENCQQEKDWYMDSNSGYKFHSILINISNYQGMVTDHKTALSWYRCLGGSEYIKGHTSNYGRDDYYEIKDGQCSDAVTEMTWQQALQYAQQVSHSTLTDWRLPNRNELMSLLNSDCDSSPYINRFVFKNIDDLHGKIWTSTPDQNSGNAWVVDFTTATSTSIATDQRAYVLLVRDKQPKPYYDRLQKRIAYYNKHVAIEKHIDKLLDYYVYPPERSDVEDLKFIANSNQYKYQSLDYLGIDCGLDIGEIEGEQEKVEQCYNSSDYILSTPAEDYPNLEKYRTNW